MYRYPRYMRPYGQTLNIGLILVALLVVYLLGRRYKLWGQPVREGEEVELDKNKPKPSPGFSPKNEVSKLADLLSVTWDNDEDVLAFDTIINYNDNETKLVHNQWRETFAGGSFWKGIESTLRKQINAETILWYRSEAIAKKKEVIKKLDRLNL
jgi:hypothetical protein